jgi:hypothetical protein
MREAAATLVRAADQLTAVASAWQSSLTSLRNGFEQFTTELRSLKRRIQLRGRPENAEPEEEAAAQQTSIQPSTKDRRVLRRR